MKKISQRFDLGRITIGLDPQPVRHPLMPLLV
jgi:hypothetical protein